MFLLGINAISLAQHYQMKAYTDKDGLSNKDITDLLIDQQGFLWIATSYGLNRFDGNAFDKFLNDPNDSNSIADNNVQKVYLDNDNRLWIGTNAGISCYHPDKQNFSNYRPDSAILPARGTNFEAFCEDNHRNIWVGTRNDLLIFNPGTNKFISSGWAAYAATHVSTAMNSLRIVVIGLIKKSEHELWVLSTYGLFSVSTDSYEFHYYPNNIASDYYGFKLCFQDDSSNVWIGSFYQGILCFNTTAGTWSQFHTPAAFTNQDNAYAITPYSGDTLIYCSGSNLILFDTKKKKAISQIPYEYLENYFFRNSASKTIALYKNMVWLGTKKGLIKIMSPDNQFHFYSLTRDENIKRVFRSASHRTVLFAKAAPQSADCFVFKKAEGSPAEPLHTQTGELFHSTYQYYAESNSGECYLNDDNHVYRYNFRTNSVTNIPLPPKIDSTNDYDVRNMVIDRKGNVWIRCLSQGIMKYDIYADKISFEKETGLSGHKEVNALYYDSLTNTIWIAEEFNGIIVYSIDQKKAVHYSIPGSPNGRSAAVISFTGDNKGNVWMADLQSGLIGYDYKSNQFTRVTSYDGLPSNNCQWMVMDPAGMLWINTEEGICKFNPVSKTFINYSSPDKDYLISFDSYLSMDKEGNISLPSQNGYYTWKTIGFKDSVKQGSIYTRDFLMLNNRLVADSNYHFSYKDNNIRILFGLLSFDNPYGLLMEYSLNGSSWNSSDIHSYISFANLAPGSYDLSVRIKNESFPMKHVRFTIEPPFWKRLWFLSLISIFILGSVILLARNKLKNIRLESSLRQRVVESEMATLRSQMNPHFIFNTLNSINSYIIENKKDEASDYLTAFSRLMRTILENSQKPTIVLKDELSALRLYLELESKRLEGSFDYTFEIDGGVDYSTKVPSLIIQPFVENAIWHGLRSKKRDGFIRIKVQNYSEGLKIFVEDNGIGMANSWKTESPKERKSFGIVATRQRLFLNDPKSKIEIEDLDGAVHGSNGTRVTIYLHQNGKGNGQA
jgi:ligand-binding sensor domain-containing protein